MNGYKLQPPAHSFPERLWNTDQFLRRSVVGALLFKPPVLTSNLTQNGKRPPVSGQLLGPKGIWLIPFKNSITLPRRREARQCIVLMGYWFQSWGHIYKMSIWPVANYRTAYKAELKMRKAAESHAFSSCFRRCGWAHTEKAESVCKICTCHIDSSPGPISRKSEKPHLIILYLWYYSWNAICTHPYFSHRRHPVVTTHILYVLYPSTYQWKDYRHINIFSPRWSEFNDFHYLF